MSANHAVKQKLVDALGEEFRDIYLLVVTEQAGLNADQTLDLRRKMRAAGVTIRVGKNTLVKRAVKGTALEGLSAYLKGPTMLAYSKDPVAAAKVAVEFAKGSKDAFKVVGAAMGDQILDASGVTALATLPSLDELRGKLIGLILAPATKIAGVLQAPAGQLARVMAARSKQAA